MIVLENVHAVLSQAIADATARERALAGPVPPIRDCLPDLDKLSTRLNEMQQVVIQADERAAATDAVLASVETALKEWFPKNLAKGEQPLVS